jgi:hypothetical protein
MCLFADLSIYVRIYTCSYSFIYAYMGTRGYEGELKIVDWIDKYVLLHISVYPYLYV